MKNKNNKAFTLIELLIVIAIIGILATVMVIAIRGVHARARDARRDADARTLIHALERYRMINARYPFSTTSEAHGVCLERDPGIQSSLKPFLPTMPRDFKYDPAKTYSLTKFCFHYRTANSGQSSIIRLNYETRAYTYKDRRSLSGPPIAFPPLAYFLFDTAATTTGRISFGTLLPGRASADAICAADVDRPAACTKKAWAFISLGGADEIRDFPITRGLYTLVPWYFRDGTASPVRADHNWADLLDGSVLIEPMHGGIDFHYPTASHANGAFSAPWTCTGGLSNSPYDWIVIGSRSDRTHWWLYRAYFQCHVGMHLLCACY
jgi:prepilin-type N-terminal cleavage/methylation domain-containing protein